MDKRDCIDCMMQAEEDGYEKYQGLYGTASEADTALRAEIAAVRAESRRLRLMMAIMTTTVNAVYADPAKAGNTLSYELSKIETMAHRGIDELVRVLVCCKKIRRGFAHEEGFILPVLSGEK